MTKPTIPLKDCDARNIPASAGEVPSRPWREDPSRGDCDVDEDTGMFEIDVRPMGPVYTSRRDLFDAVREIKDRLWRRG